MASPSSSTACSSPPVGASSPHMRRQADIARLMMAGYDVDFDEGSNGSFCVKFVGPKDTLYDGGHYKVNIQLPDKYPFKSPSIGFANRIYHPNIDESSGSICLDVLNQTWTPLYSLVNIFEHFLPQLLNYPNPADPLNVEAAMLMAKDNDEYENKVKDYVRLYAQPSESDDEDEDGSPTKKQKTGCDEEDTKSVMSELSLVGAEELDLDLDLDL